MDLESCRKLKSRIEERFSDLESVKRLATNMTAPIDGLPRCKQLDSRIERLAVKADEIERELATLRKQFEQAAVALVDAIEQRVKDQVTIEAMILRYVRCLSFRDVARAMNYSLRNVFRMIERGVKEFESYSASHM